MWKPPGNFALRRADNHAGEYQPGTPFPGLPPWSLPGISAMTAQPNTATSTLYRNACVFDGHSPELAADRVVLVAGERIESITEFHPERAVDREIDLKGKTMMPGLIDCHFHAYAYDVDVAALEEMPASYVAQRGRLLMEAALKRGFTTVRDAAGADYGLWRAVEEGHVVGPRLFYAGKALSQTGGHGDMRGAHIEACNCGSNGNLLEVVDGVEAIRIAVRENLRRGAHQIKLMLSGGVISATDPIGMPQYSRDEIAAAVDEARRRDSYVMAHVYPAEVITQAVTLGVRSIEHANLIDSAAAKVVADHDAFVVPTLVTYEALGQHSGLSGTARAKLAAVRDQGLQAVEICKHAGVRLGLGTDLMGDMHVHQLDELRIRSRVDSPFEVLHSATAVNAAIIQRPLDLGCVRPGALADLLIIDGNPLEDLSLIYEGQKGMHSIIKGGREIFSH